MMEEEEKEKMFDLMRPLEDSIQLLDLLSAQKDARRGESARQLDEIQVQAELDAAVRCLSRFQMHQDFFNKNGKGGSYDVNIDFSELALSIRKDMQEKINDTDHLDVSLDLSLSQICAENERLSKLLSEPQTCMSTLKQKRFEREKASQMRDSLSNAEKMIKGNRSSTVDLKSDADIPKWLQSRLE